MREILFKAKRIDNGKWIIGNLVALEDTEEGWKAIIIPTFDSNMFTKGGAKGDLGFENWYRVDKTTICQYTGLTDKNGKKIWENDICQYVEADECGMKIEPFIIRYGRNAEMFKINIGFFIEWIKSAYYRCDLGFWIENRNIEVIGNIFDNKDLIKE